jgi:hypothetical protein
MDNILKQFLLTPAAGKRLIARAIATDPVIVEAAQNRTVVIVAGTTNGYVAEELLKVIHQEDGFSKDRFFRGITLPPHYPVNEQGRLDEGRQFSGDVVIRKGSWDRGKIINDVIDDLHAGDVIIKGANAVNLESRQAAVLIGHSKAGTVQLTMGAAVGRRVRLYIPVGLEKRVSGNLSQIAGKLNAPDAAGNRFFVISGAHIITELEAIRSLSGAEAELVAAGGISGAEGSCWIAVSGNPDQVARAAEWIRAAAREPNFVV